MLARPGLHFAELRLAELESNMSIAALILVAALAALQASANPVCSAAARSNSTTGQSHCAVASRGKWRSWGDADAYCKQLLGTGLATPSTEAVVQDVKRAVYEGYRVMFNQIGRSDDANERISFYIGAYNDLLTYGMGEHDRWTESAEAVVQLTFLSASPWLWPDGSPAAPLFQSHNVSHYDALADQSMNQALLVDKKLCAALLPIPGGMGSARWVAIFRAVSCTVPRPFVCRLR